MQEKVSVSWMRQCKYALEFIGFMGAVALFHWASKVGGKLAQCIGPWLPVHRIGMQYLIMEQRNGLL